MKSIHSSLKQWLAMSPSQSGPRVCIQIELNTYILEESKMASKTQGSAADLASQAGERVAINRILFATDFSAVSSNAASYAKALAHRFSSSVEIAHVFDPAPVGS